MLECEKTLLHATLHNYLAPIRERLKVLETERANLKYRGTWESGVEYYPGNFITWDGGIWVCKEQTASRPGTGHQLWQLAVKSGGR